MRQEQFMFHGTLFVPVENLPTNLNFVWIGTLKSENNAVDVIAFKTDSKENFQRVLEEDLYQLEQMQEAPNVTEQKVSIKNMLKEIKKGSVFCKEPKAAMLDAATSMVAEVISRKGVSLQKSFTPQSVIYTSWVVGVL